MHWTAALEVSSHRFDDEATIEGTQVVGIRREHALAEVTTKLALDEAWQPAAAIGRSLRDFAKPAVREQ